MCVCVCVRAHALSFVIRVFVMDCSSCFHRYGRCNLRRCCPAWPDKDCCFKCPQLPEEWGTLCHLHQGMMGAWLANHLEHWLPSAWTKLPAPDWAHQSGAGEGLCGYGHKFSPQKSARLENVWIKVNWTLSLQANCIDSTAAPEAVFASEVKKMGAENMKPQEQLTLEPYERDHAVVVGVYR